MKNKFFKGLMLLAVVSLTYLQMFTPVVQASELTTNEETTEEDYSISEENLTEDTVTEAVDATDENTDSTEDTEDEAEDASDDTLESIESTLSELSSDDVLSDTSEETAADTDTTLVSATDLTTAAFDAVSAVETAKSNVVTLAKKRIDAKVQKAAKVFVEVTLAKQVVSDAVNGSGAFGVIKTSVAEARAARLAAIADLTTAAVNNTGLSIASSASSNIIAFNNSLTRLFNSIDFPETTTLTAYTADTDDTTSVIASSEKIASAKRSQIEKKAFSRIAGDSSDEEDSATETAMVESDEIDDEPVPLAADTSELATLSSNTKAKMGISIVAVALIGVMMVSIFRKYRDEF